MGMRVGAYICACIMYVVDDGCIHMGAHVLYGCQCSCMCFRGKSTNRD